MDDKNLRSDWTSATILELVNDDQWEVQLSAIK